MYCCVLFLARVIWVVWKVITYALMFKGAVAVVDEATTADERGEPLWKRKVHKWTEPKKHKWEYPPAP